MSSVRSKRAKMARRVIEVLEFFDEEQPRATATDIARHVNRPMSSTSDLVAGLVNLGLLYRDDDTKLYSLTPHVALLGTAVQPDIVRDGRLTEMIDRLSVQTGLAVAVFGMVGPKVQIFSWCHGKQILRNADPTGFRGGQIEYLCDSVVGMLLLSTVEQPRRDGMLRRLNAEASADRKFSFSEAVAKLQQLKDDRYVVGKIGFGSAADIAALLLPDQAQNQPLAIGLVYKPSERINPSKLLQSIHSAVARCTESASDNSATTRPLLEALR